MVSIRDANIEIILYSHDGSNGHFGIKTVSYSLIRFKYGSLAYITKRIDRDKKGGKIPMEDMCQLMEKLTEQKYKGSHEQIAKKIIEYSACPVLDLINYLSIYCKINALTV
jgi:serine/threonine-protein kinase HipA